MRSLEKVDLPYKMDNLMNEKIYGEIHDLTLVGLVGKNNAGEARRIFLSEPRTRDPGSSET
jgi:hypothetical protein